MSLVPGPPRTKFVVATGTCHLPPRGCGGCVPRVQTQAPGCLLRTEGGGGGGCWGRHKASVSDCVPLAAPIGLSPLLIRTLCGPERVLIVSTEMWGGGWHKASVSDCLPLAAPIGLSPPLILTLCGSERVLVVSTEMWGGGWHKASASACLPLAAPIGLSPPLILTLCGPERVLVVSTEMWGGVGTRPRHLLVCLWQRLLASRHRSL